MKKTAAIRLLIILSILGSVITFYATNLLLSDVSNMFYMSITRDVFSTVPCFMISLDFILASVYVLRLYSGKEYAKSQMILYSLILSAFSVIGIITTLYSGIAIYGSILAPYPFKYAQIVFLIFHVLMLIHGIKLLNTGKNMTAGLERCSPKLSYVIYTILLCITVFFAYNRFGAFLMAPLYIQWSSLYMTFPFYLALLLPMALLVQMLLFTFKYVDGHPDAGILHALLVFVFNIILGISVMYIGYHNTQFISAISPALGIERLMTKPIDTVLQHFFVGVFSLCELIHAKIYKKTHMEKG